jgi:hypothetical protein
MLPKRELTRLSANAGIFLKACKETFFPVHRLPESYYLVVFCAPAAFCTKRWCNSIYKASFSGGLLPFPYPL